MELVANILLIAFIVAIILFVMSLKNPKRRFNRVMFRTEDRKKLSIRYVITIVVLFIGIGVFAPQVPQESTVASTTATETKKEETPEPPKLYDVVKVIDGDTIDVSIDGKTERLRLIGVDTPETVDPRKPVQCFGKEASNHAKELLTGKKVSLERDDSQDDRDKYDRLLRYVFLEDGTNYNKQIIADGYAHEYTYNIPYKYQSSFKQAQKDADSNNKGLWSSDTCNGNTTQEAKKETSSVTEQQEPQNNTTQVAPTQPAAPTTPSTDTSVYYANCTAVRAAGADPIYAGQPGYSSKLDRDGDGVACE
jgi:micrococcal nuclease